MFKVMQRFDLDLEGMTKLGKEEKQKYNATSRVELADRLWGKGYMVFECGDTTGGIPHSVLVVGDSGHLKEDFYRIAQDLGLLYMSGDFYMPMIPSQAREGHSKNPKGYIQGKPKGIPNKKIIT